jgi:hypothetical protein
VLTALAATGWIGVVLFLMALLARPVRMLPMKIVFMVFGVVEEEQAKWALKEASRDRTLDLFKGFWNRKSQSNAQTKLTRVRGPARRRNSAQNGDDLNAA